MASSFVKKDSWSGSVYQAATSLTGLQTINLRRDLAGTPFLDEQIPRKSILGVKSKGRQADRLRLSMRWPGHGKGVRAHLELTSSLSPTWCDISQFWAEKERCCQSTHYQIHFYQNEATLIPSLKSPFQTCGVQMTRLNQGC